MKRKVAVLIILSVFLSLPLIQIPSVPVSMNLVNSDNNNTTINDDLVDQNIISADGDISSQSITSFSETSSDDVALDPDSDTNNDFSVSEWTSGESITDDDALDPDTDTNGDASYSEWGSAESITDDTLLYPDSEYLYHNDGDNISEWDFIGGLPADPAFRDIKQSTEGEDGKSIEICAYLNSTNGYDYEAYRLDLGTLFGEIPAGGQTYVKIRWKCNSSEEVAGRILVKYGDYSNHYIIDPPQNQGTWTTSYIQVNSAKQNISQIWVWAYEDEMGGHDGWFSTLVDWITIYSGSPAMDINGNNPLNNSWSESFDDERTWDSLNSIESYSTDGDVMSLEMHAEFTDDYEGIERTGLNIHLDDSTFYEMRDWCNDTVADYVQLRFLDSTGTNFYYSSPPDSTTPRTLRYRLRNTAAIGLSGSAFDTIAKVQLYIRMDTGYNITWNIDYLRISQGNETGWCYDGSTTDPITIPSQSDWDISSSSDGDVMTITYSKTGDTGDNWGDFLISYDTTDTEITIERDYFEFAALYWRVTSYDANGGTSYCSVQIYDDGYTIGTGYDDQIGVASSTTSWTTARSNLKEYSTATGNNYVDVVFRADAVGASCTIEIGYIKFYTLLNWTYYATATSDTMKSVAYYDESESALVLSKPFDTSNDYLALYTKDIHYTYGSMPCDDMVLLVTVKASSNDSCRIRPQINRAAGTDNGYYYVTDSYQTIALPLSGDGTKGDARFIYFYLYDWTTASPSSGTYQVYLKDNVTIRPSWYDASSDSGHSESFANVSDWSSYGAEGGDSFTTNGDVATALFTDQDNSDYWQSASSLGVVAHYYFEVRYKYNTTAYGSNCAVGIIKGGLYGSGGSANQYWTLVASTDWTIVRNRITATDAITGIYIYLNNAAGDYEVDFDYMRLAPETDVGFQDDFSIAAGSYENMFQLESSSTGDRVQFSATASPYGRCFLYPLDSSATFDVTKYEFLEISVTHAGQSWYIAVTWDDDTSTTLHAYAYETGIFRWGLEDVGNGKELKKIDLYFTYLADQYTEYDYIKLYGLINWTAYDCGTNNEQTGVAYYDETDSAIVIEKEFDSSADYVGIRPENTSINYATTDMSVGFTAKASANSSCRIRVLLYDGATYTDRYYFLIDSYQTFWMHLDEGEDYSSITYILIRLYDWETTTPGSGTYQVYLMDNMTIRPSWYDASEESGTFGESFADVDDIYVALGETITTDGDLGTFSHPGDSAWDYYYWNSPSAMTSQIIELRYICNLTGSYGNLGIALYSEDNGAGSQLYNTGNIAFTTTATTRIFSAMASGVESIRLVIKADSSPASIQFDYLRIADATDMGYQIDASSVAEFVATSIGDYPYAVSDGDVISFENGDGLSYFDYDITDLDVDYYPFIEVKISALDSQWWKLYIWDGVGTQTAVIDTTYTTGTFRANLKATLADDEADWLRIYYYSGFDLDYIKFYSIANYTVSIDASAVSGDILFIDSNNALNIDTSSAHYLGLNLDPSLSLDTASYNIWNITDNNPTGADYIQFYVGASWETHYLSNTRGTWTGSGTLIDLNMVFYYDQIVSALTFIEDNTAPTIQNFWTVPYTVTEEDDMSLAVYATDAVDVYSVIFNAIDYPSGFNDIDYEATESSEQEGLFNYDFSSSDLVAGYYAILVTVSDGVNTATDLNCFRIVTVVLQITDIVLITATEQTAQLSGHSNKDCSYQIYENDTLQGSGSISDGWFSLAWTKDNTAGAYIELGIKFYVSTYTEWINGSYSVASATVLSIINTLYSSTSTENRLSGTTNLATNYYIYDNDSLQSSGSLTAGSFSVSSSRSATEGLHIWSVKFNDGVTTIWSNASYDVTATNFQISDVILSGDEQVVHISGYATVAGNYYVFENDTYASVSGAFSAGSVETSWQRSTTNGLHNWAIKYNTSASVTRWINGSYYVSPTSFVVTVYLASSTTVEEKVSGYLTTAANYSAYDDDVLKTSGSLSAGSYEVSWTRSSVVGLHEWGILFNASGTLRWVNGSYYVGEDDFAFTALSFAVDELTVTVTIHSNWGNGTITITDQNGDNPNDQNDNVISGVSEDSYTFNKIKTEGYHPYSVEYDAGGYSHTWNLQYSYEIDPSGGFDEGDVERVGEEVNKTVGEAVKQLSVWRPGAEDFLMFGTIMILVVIIIGQRLKRKHDENESAGIFGWLGISLPKLGD